MSEDFHIFQDPQNLLTTALRIHAFLWKLFVHAVSAGRWSWIHHFQQMIKFCNPCILQAMPSPIKSYQTHLTFIIFHPFCPKKTTEKKTRSKIVRQIHGPSSHPVVQKGGSPSFRAPKSSWEKRRAQWSGGSIPAAAESLQETFFFKEDVLELERYVDLEFVILFEFLFCPKLKYFCERWKMDEVWWTERGGIVYFHWVGSSCKLVKTESKLWHGSILTPFLHRWSFRSLAGLETTWDVC